MKTKHRSAYPYEAGDRVYDIHNGKVYTVKRNIGRQDYAGQPDYTITLESIETDQPTPWNKSSNLAPCDDRQACILSTLRAIPMPPADSLVDAAAHRDALRAQPIQAYLRALRLGYEVGAALYELRRCLACLCIVKRAGDSHCPQCSQLEKTARYHEPEGRADQLILRIMVKVEGGLVHDVVIEGLPPGDVKVVIMDYDTDGADPEDLRTDTEGQEYYHSER